MVVAGSERVKALSESRRALGQAEQPAFDPLERSAVGEGDEERVVASDRAGDFGPACPIEGGGDRMRRAWQRPEHEEQAGFVDLDREVPQELAQAVLTGRLRLDQSWRQGIGGGPLAGQLDQPKLRDIAR